MNPPPNKQHDGKPVPPSRLRTANGIASAAIVLLFLFHGLAHATGAPSLATIAWVGVAIVFIHVLMCVGTSTQMLTDQARPPSMRKKLHLALKWVSGIVLGVVALAHALGLADATTWFLAALTLLIAWHTWVGSRSLLKDLRLDTGYRNVFRIAALVAAAVIVVLLLVAR